MGLFDRLSQVLRSNINDLISRSEDPEKMLNQIIIDMRSQLVKAKQQVASAIADEKRLRDQEILLALRLLDLVVEVAQRLLQLVRLHLVLLPRHRELLCMLEMLLPAQQRLLGQVVAVFLHREHRALVPVVGELELRVGLVLQALLVGDGGSDLLLRLRELVAHVDDDLIQHLLGVFRRGDEVVQVRLDQRREAIENPPGSANLSEGGQLAHVRRQRQGHALVRGEELLVVQVRELQRLGQHDRIVVDAIRAV